MQFCQWNRLISIKFSSKSVPWDNKKSSLVKIMDWRQTLYKTMMTLIGDAYMRHYGEMCLKRLKIEQNGRHFVDDSFKDILLKENNCVFNLRSLNSVPKGPINNKSVSRYLNKPLSESTVTEDLNAPRLWINLKHAILQLITWKVISEMKTSEFLDVLKFILYCRILSILNQHWL